MNYLDHLTTSQRALVLARGPEEALELIEHGIKLDQTERAQLKHNANKLESAGYQVGPMHKRGRALTRSIRAGRDAAWALKQELAKAQTAV